LSCSRLNSKGSLAVTVILVLLTVVLAAACFFWFKREQAPPSASSPAVSASSPAFTGDSSQATTLLLTTLNHRLEELDILKLLDERVAVEPVTYQGKIFPGYHETFRLPARYTADAIAEVLNRSVQPMGAQSVTEETGITDASGENQTTFDFGYNADFAPVRLSFVRVKRPEVCLIIDDGGYKKGQALEDLYQFKVPVTLSIIPDLQFSRDLAKEAPAHGIEVMCHMPMQGHEEWFTDNYKEFLKLGMRVEDVEQVLGQALDALPGCVGMNNHMGSQATADEDLMLKVCQVLKARNLYLIDSRTTAQSVEADEAVKVHLVHAKRDIFLDNVVAPEAILIQLRKLVRVAKKNGVGVGIGHFKPVTLATLRDAIPALKAQGIQFVYASEVVKE
jgi:polysaccharide deacetylase 2 family uncharacterized protein YibQ